MPEESPPQRTVLLVDDNEEFRIVATLALENAGYLVQQAADGLSALDLLQQTRPDLIISDLHMPLLDGRALCERLRAAQDFAQIPFVILSAYVESSGPHILPDVPADFCYSKQSPFSALLPQLERLLASRA